MTPTICTITHILGTSTIDALPNGGASVTDRDYDGTVLGVRTYGAISEAMEDAADLAADLGAGECLTCGGTRGAATAVYSGGARSVASREWTASLPITAMIRHAHSRRDTVASMSSQATPRQRTLVTMGTPAHATALADLAVLLLAASGEDVTKDEVRGALSRSLTGLLDLRERAWKAAR